MVTAVFDLFHELDVTVKSGFDRVDKATRPSYYVEIMSVIEKAMSETDHAIANVVKIHIASIAALTTLSIPSLERLVLAVAAAAAESMRGIIDTVTLMNDIPPTPYESLKYLSDRWSQTPSDENYGDKEKEVPMKRPII